MSEEQIENVENKYPDGIELVTAQQPEEPNEHTSLKGLLKLKCECGSVTKVSDEIISDGLTWTMLIGNDHWLTFMCPECGSKLTMFIEQIQEDELPQESNKE